MLNQGLNKTTSWKRQTQKTQGRKATDQNKLVAGLPKREILSVLPGRSSSAEKMGVIFIKRHWLYVQANVICSLTDPSAVVTERMSLLSF